MIDTLQRQHKITLRRIGRIEKAVANAIPTETVPEPEPQVSLGTWFRQLLGLEPKGGARNGTSG